MVKQKIPTQPTILHDLSGLLELRIWDVIQQAQGRGGGQRSNVYVVEARRSVQSTARKSSRPRDHIQQGRAWVLKTVLTLIWGTRALC